MGLSEILNTFESLLQEINSLQELKVLLRSGVIPGGILLVCDGRGSNTVHFRRTRKYTKFRIF